MNAIATPLGTLDVHVEGRVDNGHPVAVLWHSLFVDERSWDRVAPALAEDRSLVMITGPGHGRSEARTRRYDLGDCASAALQVLKGLAVTAPADWVGNAWGGHVGILLAAMHPERVRSLAVFNAPVQALTRAQARAPRMLAGMLRVAGPVGPARSGVVAALLSERTRRDDPDAVSYVDGCLRAADPAALATAIRSISLDRPDLRPLLTGIVAPTLFVTSPEDALWTPEQATAAAALMPDAAVEVVDGGHHLTPLENPDETIALVRELWSRTART